jgi:2-methylisocitrate lyase-like PEP mutase family enzyme
VTEQTDRFRALHAGGIFVMPNPWDIGSARYLAAMGFSAIATTSSGHAASLGRPDQAVTRDELLLHVEALVGAVEVPVNVDAERCFAEDPAGVAETVRLIADTGAAGCSIEDWDPSARRIDPVELAAERVAAAAEMARAHGLVLTGRAENHLYGIDDLRDTIVRLCAYRDAGAEVLYAPGLVDHGDIARVVDETGMPINVLSLADGPSVAQLGSVGVRRVSTGGALSRAAFGALDRAGRELLESGTSRYAADALPTPVLRTAFNAGGSGHM